MLKLRALCGAVVVLCALLLSACCSSCKPPVPPKPISPTPCEAAYLELQWVGATMVETGDKIKIILPADLFFAPKSTALRRSSYATLNQIGRVLQCYKKVDVRISAYTDSCGDPIVNRALTEQQAKKITDFLWYSGANARILFPYGYGAANPISSNTTEQGRKENRRIEITFTRVTQPML